MAKARMRLRTMLLAGILLAVLLAPAGRWVASGCPVGFTCGACQTSLDGLAIVASSDHLLTNISLSSDKTSAVLEVEGRHIVVRGSEAVIDDTTKVVIPAGCKKIEFIASGGVLRVSADGKTIREIQR